MNKIMGLSYPLVTSFYFGLSSYVPSYHWDGPSLIGPRIEIVLRNYHLMKEYLKNQNNPSPKPPSNP
jgi:hypothetical protein